MGVQTLLQSSYLLRTLFVSLTIAILAWISLVCYRLFWSPLARVPGPKLAAISFWYEYYYDVIKTGQYTWKIKELHEKYGPVVRINPYEVHIDDPEFYDQVYVGASVRPTDKWGWSAEMFQVNESTVSTVPHALHRRRRAMYSHHFSAASVSQMSGFIRTKVAKLLQRIDLAEKTQQPINLTYAYSALTMDIITAYIFIDSFNYLDSPDFAAKPHQVFVRTSVATHFAKQFPGLVKAFRLLPPWLLRLVSNDFRLLFDLQRRLITLVQAVVDRRTKTTPLAGKPSDLETDEGTRKTLFDAMLDADVPAPEKSITRMGDEAQLFVAAGTLTTAHALMTTTYHVLANPDIQAQLRDELARALAATTSSNALVEDFEEPSLQIPIKTLESLPYLNAVIREGLRLSYGVPQRLQRISNTTSLQYKNFEFPPGTPVSMSALMMHENPKVFADPFKFNPDRWLPLETVGQQLNKYFVPFSRGSRACVGMNLAWAELYLAMAAVFGKDRAPMKMHGVVFDRDVKTTIDGFNPLVSLESKGLQVLVGA